MRYPLLSVLGLWVLAGLLWGLMLDDASADERIAPAVLLGLVAAGAAVLTAVYVGAAFWNHSFW